MAGGTLWKGIIHFGGIDVPVKLPSGVREDRIQLHLLHSRDQVKLRQQMICAYDKQPVPAEEQCRLRRPIPWYSTLIPGIRQIFWTVPGWR
jgi:DNA end-binding protein Ku